VHAHRDIGETAHGGLAPRGVEIWPLLERLPRSFLLFKVLPPTGGESGASELTGLVREVMPQAAAVDVGALCDTALRTGEEQMASVPGLALHLSPVRRERRIAGLLAVGARSQAGADTEPAAQADLAGRVRASGNALRRSLEQEVGVPDPFDERTKARRLLAVARFLAFLREVDSERELFRVASQAAAVWYDVDAFAYRREVGGGFVIDVSLPGTDVSARPRELPPAVAARLRDTPVLLSSLVELEALGWREPSGDVLLIPVGLPGRPMWVFAVAGAITEECQATMGAMRMVLAGVVQRLGDRRVATLEDRLRQVLREDVGAPEGLFPLLLDAVIKGAQGERGRLAMELPEGEIVLAATPRLAMTSGAGEGDRLALALPLPRGTLHLELEPPAGQPFSPVATAVIEAGAGVIQDWMVWTLQARERAAVLPGAFAARISEELARARRFGLEVSLVLITVPPPPEAPATAADRALIEALRRALRGTDLVGEVGTGEIAAVLVHTGLEGASSVTGRLTARLQELVAGDRLRSITIGQAAFHAGNEGGPALLAQARANQIVLFNAPRTET
jgi:hypothetical protein